MQNISLSKFELEILKSFLKSTDHDQLSPKDIDLLLKLGIDRTIALFFELEAKGLVKWISLNLIELDLERSTKEIYQEVYNSTAKLTSDIKVIQEKLSILNNQKA